MSELDRMHPALRAWFLEEVGQPTRPQQEGWPRIRTGGNVLVAAPTGSGKTLAAFLWAIDALLQQGEALPEETQVVYVSPLKALGNDVRKNLAGPLARLREREPRLPEVRVQVRTGDTRAAERERMRRKPPHILVTTPESLSILLTAQRGRENLRAVRTVIVDEIHALLQDRRGAHLALTLERLERLTGRPFQRIGLSATQRPIEEVGRFLGGVEREVAIVDCGHARPMELSIALPASPLGAVCAHEVWEELYDDMVRSIEARRTTLVFVNTRKLAERVSARLAERLGADRVACHHGSLARERRLAAEERLKRGELRALVATASLELGIDVGEVDLVLQIGSVRRIATFLQRVGRAGRRERVPSQGRLYPLTRDELVEALALFRAIAQGELDRTVVPCAPVDILLQQVVATCANETVPLDELYALVRRAWPYRDLERAAFDAALALHVGGRAALLHRDATAGTLRGTRRARTVAITCGGAIPDNANYRVVEQPHETHVGSVDEDFAIESSVGDVFQLGATSWRVLKVEPGTMRVANAEGAPPSLPFWFGEAPARSDELSAQVGAVRDLLVEDPEALARVPGITAEALERAREYVEEGRRVLGVVPTTRRIVFERFFDESGGMQLVVHAPFGNRINRAYGLALRKRFCRHFGFELQAAANEDAIVLSLGPQHSFPLEEVAGYLHPERVEALLQQALLALPLFKIRWRWNATRALVVERFRTGRRVPPPLLRMRVEDALVQAFPDAIACPETMAAGDVEIPLAHPLVGQTVRDCLTEALDVEGLRAVLQELRAGTLEVHAIDTPAPSVFAAGVLEAAPYAFLDDAPLEERRTQAVLQRRARSPADGDALGDLDPRAVERVREEAWPDPRDAAEVHEALQWMGFVRLAEAPSWEGWLGELLAAGKVRREGDRWFAVEASRDPADVLAGRLEALGPTVVDDPVVHELERRGAVLRTRVGGVPMVCDRRLLARIQAYTVESLRQAIRPVDAARYLRFLASWQHAIPATRSSGPEGVRTVLAQLAGLERPAALWEKEILPLRVEGYRREWLDEVTLNGEFTYGRLWSAGLAPLRRTPIAFLPRERLEPWLALAPPLDDSDWPSSARAVLAVLERRGACFLRDLQREAGPLPALLERGLAEAFALGALTCDGFSAVRQLLVPHRKRRRELYVPGRFSAFRNARAAEAADPEETARFLADVLLDRYGVVVRKVVDAERLPVPWRLVARALRTMEWRGEVRGGRFVAGFHGEQFARPAALTALRRTSAEELSEDVPEVHVDDPLNLRGILTPESRQEVRRQGRVRVVRPAASP